MKIQFREEKEKMKKKLTNFSDGTSIDAEDGALTFKIGDQN
jgi:hypothetical protein